MLSSRKVDSVSSVENWNTIYMMKTKSTHLVILSFIFVHFEILVFKQDDNKIFVTFFVVSLEALV